MNSIFCSFLGDIAIANMSVKILLVMLAIIIARLSLDFSRPFHDEPGLWRVHVFLTWRSSDRMKRTR